MPDWYYAANGQQPTGPVSSEDLRHRLSSGQLDAHCLLWREGLQRWHSPGELAQELGQPAPILPAPPPASLPPALGPARISTSSNARPSPPARRTGLILVLAGAGLLLVMVPVLAILAAIAIPAYNSYTERARTAAILRAVAPLQDQVAGFVQEQGHCPDQGSPGFATPESYADPARHIAAVDLVTAINGNCGLAVRLHGLHRDKETRQAWLWLEHQRADGRWVCRSTLRKQQLSARCQLAGAR